MRAILWTKPDGRFAITTLAPGAQETLEEVAARIVPEGVPFVISDTTIPQDRTFRMAWKEEAGDVVVDMPKAREIQRDRWREARAPLLEALDKETIKALVAKDDARSQVVEARKQSLRDVTTTDLSSVTTPEELKDTWPRALTDPLP